MEIIAELFLGLTNAENCSFSVDLLGNPMAAEMSDPVGRHVATAAYALAGHTFVVASVCRFPLSSSHEGVGAAFVKKMILISLIANVLILIPVCICLIWDTPQISSAYGSHSPARGILLSVYGAILLISIALLFKPLPILVAPLLLVQILYKITTPFTVGSFTNPVVISNLVVAALHLITLYLILRTIRGKSFYLESS